jgi:hypothetical protein
MAGLSFVLEKVFQNKIPLSTLCEPMIPPLGRQKINADIVARFDDYKSMTIEEFIHAEPHISRLDGWWLSSQGSMFMFYGPFPKTEDKLLPTWVMLVELNILKWLKNQPRALLRQIEEIAFYKEGEHPVYSKQNIGRFWQSINSYSWSQPRKSTTTVKSEPVAKTIPPYKPQDKNEVPSPEFKMPLMPPIM